MSYVGVSTTHGHVDVGEIFAVRKQDGTKALLVIVRPRGDFFEVTQLLPSLNMDYALSQEEFQSYPVVKRATYILSDNIPKLIELLRFRKIIAEIEKTYDNV